MVTGELGVENTGLSVVPTLPGVELMEPGVVPTAPSVVPTLPGVVPMLLDVVPTEPTVEPLAAELSGPVPPRGAVVNAPGLLAVTRPLLNVKALVLLGAVRDGIVEKIELVEFVDRIELPSVPNVPEIALPGTVGLKPPVAEANGFRAVALPTPPAFVVAPTWPGTPLV
jgi:hypothetical protein